MVTELPRRERIRAKILRRVRLVDVKRRPGDGLGEWPFCWEWTGPTSGVTGRGRGYPRMSLDGATVAVHKAMFVNQFGIVPPKKQIDHKCRNRLCVNPHHLELVTHKTNQRRRRKTKEAKVETSSDC